MSKVLYVCTKDLGPGPELIGTLTRTGADSYEFAYAARATKSLDGLRDRAKVYTTDEINATIFAVMSPEPQTFAHAVMCDSLGLPRNYANRWELLDKNIDAWEANVVPFSRLHDGRETMYFYRELPERLWVYPDGK